MTDNPYLVGGRRGGKQLDRLDARSRELIASSPYCLDHGFYKHRCLSCAGELRIGTLRLERRFQLGGPIYAGGPPLAHRMAEKLRILGVRWAAPSAFRRPLRAINGRRVTVVEDAYVGV